MDLVGQVVLISIMEAYREVFLENGKTWYVIDKRLEDGSLLSIFSSCVYVKSSIYGIN